MTPDWRNIAAAATGGWKGDIAIDDLIIYDDGADYDSDGLLDSDELLTYGTDPLKSDTDNDGMSDYWEVLVGLDPLTDDSLLDPDGDGLNNLGEFTNQRDPFYRDHPDCALILF